VSLGTLIGAVTFFLARAIFVAQTLFLAWVLVSLLAFAPFLPVYTPSRSRVFRSVKWIFLLATLWLALKVTPLFFACLWSIAWVEWTRASIRRKLPITEWPRQLYL
jgi:hypothetical protein